MNATAATAAANLDIEPMVRFDASQKRFFEDQARVIVVNWHRQKGKDFTAAAKAVENAARTGQSWFIVSITQRQADATFAKCRQFAEAYRRVAKLQQELRYSETDFTERDKTIDQIFQCKAREITFPSGGRVVSLPGRDPDTLAGLTGNIILTEFGLFPGGGYAHWSVIFPITTRGFQVIVISTPRGKNTKFYELWRDSETYSVHTCDIEQSVNQEGFVLRDNKGNPTTIAAFRRLYNDEGKWPREYMCQFTGDLESLVKWAQIEAAAALGAGLDFSIAQLDAGGALPLDFFTNMNLRAAGGRVEIGWDVARRGHLSVVTGNLNRMGRPKQLRFVILMHGVPFATQRGVVTAAMEAGGYGSVGCGDSTGLGMESNEFLEGKFRDRWTGVNFGGTRKKELASNLATAFGDCTQTLPGLEKYKFIATDVYAIQKDDTGGQLALDETDNVLLMSSHCDIAWSLALARMAGAKNAVRSLPESLPELPAGYT